jgi:hypothetical protein
MELIPFLSSDSKEASATDEIQLIPVERERLTPAQFLRTMRERRDLVESSSYNPPQLGDDHFGYFDVEYREPIYE